jgi:hypothetical protein
VPCCGPLGPGVEDDIVSDAGRLKSGTVVMASVGPWAGVLPCVRAGWARVSDRGILSVQCV